MSVRVLAYALLIATALAPARAAPFVPASDAQVVERLPSSPNGPVIRGLRELRALHSELTRAPDNLPLALRVAEGYLELGRGTGDLRYVGYAQAALAPWWDLEQPAQEVLLLRAALRQRMHQFDAALADLAMVLNANPRNARARLTRATLLQVRGAYQEAREDCRALRRLTQELVWVACLTNVNGATGELRESYEQLRAALDRSANAQPRIRGWVLASLAEMAARAGMTSEAEAHFRAALAVDPADSNLLAAYADFLLENRRTEEVLELLRDKTRADPLLLRYALALQAQNSKELPNRVEQLRDRFAASGLRGDRVHLREEARFALHLLNDAPMALRLAQENWRLQKEPADLRILLEAALGTRDGAAVDEVREWLRSSGLEDVYLQRIIGREDRSTAEGEGR